MKIDRRFFFAAPTAFAACCLLSSPARAGGDAEACARSAEKGQDLRSDGHLLSALTQLRLCTRPSCPAFVRRDCAQWESDVEASVPTVVVAARSRDNRDLVDVRVTVDGAPFAATIDGIAKPLDPGEHRFRFEADGAPAVEQLVVLREGEKRRTVQVAMGAPQPQPTPPSSSSASSSPATADSSRGIWPWVFAGIGLAAAGTGSALAVTGLSDYHGLQSTCGQSGNCEPSRVDSARTRLWIGDVAIVAGVVSLGVAGWLAFRPLPGGGAVQVTGTL